jgi:hypothetical protein
VVVLVGFYAGLLAGHVPAAEAVVYWLLPVVHWLLAIGCCLLSIVYCLFAIGCCLLSIVYCLLAIGYWLLSSYGYCDRLDIGYNALQHATPYTRTGGYAQ